MTTFQWIAGSGDWETAADWNQDAVPGYGDDVILGGSGAYDVTIEAGSIFTGSNVSVDSVTIDDPAATLSVAGVLGLYAGQQQTLVLQEGTLFLAGTIDGGTLSFGSGTLDFATSPSVIGYNGPDDSPALNDVTLLGALDLSAADTDVVLAYGTKVETASGQAGTIDVSGAGDELILSNTTLDDVTLTLTLGKDSNGRDTLLLAIGTVTLGSGVTTTLDATNAGGTIGGDTLINEGLLSVVAGTSEIVGNAVFEAVTEFVNSGTLAIGAGANYVVQSGSFTNNGLIDVGARGLLAEDLGSFTDNGTIALQQGTFGIAGSATLGSSGSIVSSEFGFIDIGGTLDIAGGTLAVSGSIDITGTLDISGGTVDLSGGEIDLSRESSTSLSPALEFNGGTIANAVIREGTSSLTFYTPVTLSDDTIVGPLQLDTDNPNDLAAGSTVDIINGLTLENASGGAATIDVTGAFASLVANDSQAWNNLTIDIGSTGDNAGSDILYIAVGDTLTLGSQTTIMTSFGQTADIDGGSLVDDGTIDDGGTINALIGGSFVTSYDGVISVANGATLNLGSAASAATPVSFVDEGILALNGGILAIGPGVTVTTAFSSAITGFGTIEGSVVDRSLLQAASGELTITGFIDGVPYTGSSYVEIAPDSTLDPVGGTNGTIDFGGAIDFHGTGENATLVLATPSVEIAGLYGLAIGDRILLSRGTITSASLSYNALTLDLAGGGTAEYAIASFGINNLYPVEVIDNGAGVEIACFRRGTRIATPLGERPVESLCVGDTVLTASGEKRTIRWLGHQTLDLRHHPHPHTAWPVRIAAGAIAPMLPLADLWLSPEHAVLLDDLLIPAIRLANDATIAQVPVETVEYWHLELDSHDLVRAEGLAAESYLDTGTREGFDEGPAWLAENPDATPFHWTQTCRPLVLEGEALVAVRQALQARAEALGYRWTDAHDLHVMADGRRIDGTAIAEGQWRFAIPHRAALLRLVSRIWVPAHAIPGSADVRRLGVCVGRLQVDGVDRHLAAQDGAAGWHPAETEGTATWRWTSGAAALPAGARSIIVDVVGPGRYVAAPGQPQAASRAAA